MPAFLRRARRGRERVARATRARWSRRRRAWPPTSRASRAPWPTARPPSIAALLDAAVGALEAGFDARHGGWGGAPKFPQPMAIDFLLRRAAAGDARALPMARRSLERMAAGGIHDQLGGGFHRYATDAAWLVPHFEKMLYDNAQLARVYLHAWALTGDPAHLRGGDRHARLRRPRDDLAGRRLRGQPRRRHRGRGGRDLHLDRGRDARGPRRSGLDEAWPLVRGGLRRDRGRQLGGPGDPPAGGDRYRPRGAARAAAREVADSSSAPGARCWPRAIGDPSRPATTRPSRPGTGSRSARSPTPPGCSRGRTTRSWARPRRAIGRSPSARRAGCSRCSVRRTGASVGPGRTAKRATPGRWRTRPAWRTGSWPSTRRRPTSAGSRPRPRRLTRSSRTSPTRPAASSTRRTTTRRS